MPPAPFTLRDLPLPAKLVISTFLIAVGFGYFSALVQIHLQHGKKDGEPLPTVDDIVEKFAGLRPFDGVYPVSKIEGLITGDPYGGFDKNNMTPAFFAKSGSAFDKDVKERGKDVVEKERHGERKAMLAYIKSDPSGRKDAYEKDAFTLPADLAGHPITEDYFDAEKKAVKIQSLFTDRCAKCHGGDKPPELTDFAKIEPHITAPSPEVVDGKWVRSGRQLSVEALTQSTHAHLLSFAMLFGLTGLAFAFTGYPAAVRGVLGPLVLVTLMADISCWWLARLPGVGPTFAMAILGTGGVAGTGLGLQIVLSLFSMYRTPGRLVLLLLTAVIGAGFLVLGVKVIEPALKAERASASQNSANPTEK